MNPIRCDHNSEYHCWHILRFTLYAVFTNAIPLEPHDSGKMPVIDSAYWILILRWW